MDNFLARIVPHRWWHWPASILFWGTVATLFAHGVDIVLYGRPTQSFSSNFRETLLTAAPLVVFALLLVRHTNRLHQEALKMSLTDPLTGLLNRRAFLNGLTKQTNGVLFMLDLDHFKDVNDGYGHPVGDEVLCAMADKMRDLVRETDLIGRLGGEEFAIFVTDLEAADANLLSARLCEGVHHDEVFSGTTIVVTSSIGLLQAKHGFDVKLMLRDADKALYEAKASGRARAVWGGSDTLDEIWLPP